MYSVDWTTRLDHWTHKTVQSMSKAVPLAATIWLQYFEGLNFRSLWVNPLFGNFCGIYFRCMHYHLLVTE